MARVGRMMVLVLSGLALALLAGCSGSGANKAGGTQPKPVVLTLVDGEDDVSNAQPFANAVDQLSKGTLRIAIKSPWRPNDPRYESDLIKDVEAGKAQLGVTASRAFDTDGIDSFEALQAPFLIDSITLERGVLASGITARMLAGLERSGLVGLAILAGPLRRPLDFFKPLLSLSDYRGARIGTRPSDVTDETLRALGATPVQLARNADTSGLDGVDAHIAQFDAGYAQRGATITGNVDLEPRPNVLFINQRAFNSLSSTQRRILTRAAAQVGKTGAVYQPDAGSAPDLCRRGVKIVAASAADLAGLRAAVQPVYTSLESNPSTKALIEQITAIRRAVGGTPDIVRCTAHAVNSGIADAATVLDGKWDVTYTHAQFMAAGAQAGEDIPGNWGYFTLTFNRGRWIDAGPDVAPGDGPASGTYVVKGDQITFYRKDHAYPGSDTEIWGPYIWSVYRDTLTFREGASFGMGPTGLTVKPWRKLGNAP